MQAPTTSEGGLGGRDPQVRPCPACGAENTTSATFCWRCYGAFGSGAPQESAPTQPVTWPPAPRPAEESKRRTGTFGSIVAVAVGVVAAVAFVMLREPGVSFPERVAGLERASDAQSEAAAASFRAASEADGLEADMAFYAEGGIPVAALAWIRGYDGNAGGPDEAFDGFIEGFTSGYNGSVVTADRAERTVDGVAYVCAPVAAAVTAGICMWEDEDVFWVLMDVRPGVTIEQTEALAVTAHDAA